MGGASLKNQRDFPEVGHECSEFDGLSPVVCCSARGGGGGNLSQSYKIAHELDRVVRRIEARMHQRMPSLDTRGIGPLGGLVLLHIAEMQPCSMQRLCEQVGRDPSQMTRVVRNLENKGVVSRTADPDDRRVSMLSLSLDGTEFVSVIKTTLSDVVDGIVAPLTDAERDLFLRLLLRV